MAVKDYFVRVKTAAMDGGGTDSDVFVSIGSESGRSSNWCYLDDPNCGDLEQGYVDTFIFQNEDFDLGKGFNSFGIALRPSGSNPSWYLEWILVGEWVNGDVGRSAGQVYSPPRYIGHRYLPSDAVIVYPFAFQHNHPCFASPVAEPLRPLTPEELQIITRESKVYQPKAK